MKFSYFFASFLLNLLHENIDHVAIHNFLFTNKYCLYYYDNYITCIIIDFSYQTISLNYSLCRTCIFFPFFLDMYHIYERTRVDSLFRQRCVHWFLATQDWWQHLLQTSGTIHTSFLASSMILDLTMF